MNLISKICETCEQLLWSSFSGLYKIRDSFTYKGKQTYLGRCNVVTKLMCSCSRSCIGLMQRNSKFCLMSIICQNLIVKHTDFVKHILTSGYFFHWDISVVCRVIVLKLAVTVFTSLPCRTLWPNWLNYFQSFKKIGLWAKTTQTHIQIILWTGKIFAFCFQPL